MEGFSRRGRKLVCECSISYEFSHTTAFGEGRIKQGEKCLQRRTGKKREDRSECYFALDDSLVPFTPTWEQRLARNARPSHAPRLIVTLHGLPVPFARSFGFDLFAASLLITDGVSPLGIVWLVRLSASMCSSCWRFPWPFDNTASLGELFHLPLLELISLRIRGAVIARCSLP